MMRFFRSFVVCLGALMGLWSSTLLADLPPPARQPENLPRLLSGHDVARAITYSGYREGQAPGQKEPSYQEILEDLRLLSRHWNLLRLYGANQHAEAVLNVIEKEKLPLKVMQGIWLTGEVNNPGSPWAWPMSPEQIEWNKAENVAEVGRAIALGKKYPTIISSFSVGNEVIVDWTDHLVPLPSLIEHVRRLKAAVPQLVTVSDNYVPWARGPDELVEELDFICIHSYPVWENKPIEEALAFTKANYEAVAERYPYKAIAFGEAGWTTKTNNMQISAESATEANQKRYFEEFSAWTESEGIVAFFFASFDETWKGGWDPLEPEKHWGLFYSDRTPKPAIQELFR